MQINKLNNTQYMSSFKATQKNEESKYIEVDINTKKGAKAYYSNELKVEGLSIGILSCLFSAYQLAKNAITTPDIKLAKIILMSVGSIASLYGAFECTKAAWTAPKFLIKNFKRDQNIKKELIEQNIPVHKI